MITLRDEAGRGVFAFSPKTDPYDVLALVAWAHPRGIPLCDCDCPRRSGSYCVECHCVAHAALVEAKTRPEALS